MDSPGNTSSIMIVGGNSGMGLALAERCLGDGAHVIIVGRSQEKLAAASDRLGSSEKVRTAVADFTNEEQVSELFARCGDLSHIVCTAADIRGAYELLPDLKLEAAVRAIESKVLGPLLLAKYGAPRLVSSGSLTFVSGIAAYRPMARGSVVATINAALEGLVRALAVELGPIRVNAVSPGWVDTPIWDFVAGDKKGEMLAAMANRLPVGRIGQATDIADAISFLMHNGFTTGTVLHAEGGHRLI